MIWLDVTKFGRAGYRSGLNRVTGSLQAALGAACRAVTGVPADLPATDWYLTAELFSERERPGLTAFLADRRCRCAAIFHDAIPLRYPDITWPQSVARHPEYLKLLARFDRVWAVSAASRADLLGIWRWQGVTNPPPVEVLALGADAAPGPRPASGAAPSTPPLLLCVGILEPRKNQALLLDVCEELWAEGQRFELHLVGRSNPHFGAPLAARIRTLSRRQPLLQYHGAASDAAVAALYARAWASAFPTLAEGCGLPLLESLWHGVPCVCSDLPVLREQADGGGCVPVAVADRPAWKAALQRLLNDPAGREELAAAARRRPLPTWAAAAAALQARLTAA